MKSKEILKKFEQEIQEKGEKGCSLSSDIIFYSYYTKENIDKEDDHWKIWKQFFDLKFIPEHNVYAPKDTMTYKKPCYANGDFPYYILWLDPLKILKTLAKDEIYNMNRGRYVQGCYDLSIGESRIVKVAFENGQFKLIDGRHRILVFLAHCKYRSLPCYLPKENVGASFEEKFKDFLKTPDDVKITIENNQYCIAIPTK